MQLLIFNIIQYQNLNHNKSDITKIHNENVDTTGTVQPQISSPCNA